MMIPGSVCCRLLMILHPPKEEDVQVNGDGFIHQESTHIYILSKTDICLFLRDGQNAAVLGPVLRSHGVHGTPR